MTVSRRFFLERYGPDVVPCFIMVKWQRARSERSAGSIHPVQILPFVFTCPEPDVVSYSFALKTKNRLNLFAPIQVIGCGGESITLEIAHDGGWGDLFSKKGPSTETVNAAISSLREIELSLR